METRGCFGWEQIRRQHDNGAMDVMPACLDNEGHHMIFLKTFID